MKETTKTAKRILVVVLIIVTAAVLFVVSLYYGDVEREIFPRTTYSNTENYLSALNLYTGIKYAEIIDLFGTPDEIRGAQGNDNEFYMVYKDIEIPMLAEADAELSTGEFIPYRSIIIYGDSIRLGDKNIGVGSSKFEVVIAYLGVSRITNCGIGEGYVDGHPGDNYVQFEYNDDHKVTKIIYAPVGP